MDQRNFFSHDGQTYGVTTLGKRGQVVIPNDLRRDLRLKEGDKLLVFCRFGRLVALIKTSELQGFLTAAMRHFGTQFVPSRLKRKIAKAKNKSRALSKELLKSFKK